MARKPRKRSHGQGTIWKRGPRAFVVKWRENGKRRTSPAYETYDLADRIRAKIVADIAAGNSGLPRNDSATFAVLGDAILERRKLTHRAWNSDLGRWKRHVRPILGERPASSISTGHLRAFIEQKLGEGMNPTTVGLCIRLISALFTDLVERAAETGVTVNPVRQLTRATRKLYKPTHDPKDTPFLETLEDVEKVRLQIAKPTVSAAFAVGAYAGLRPGEVKGLHVDDIDLRSRKIRVWRQVVDGSLGPLKDSETRFVPILDRLFPILEAYLQALGTKTGALFRPIKRGGGRKGSAPTYVQEHTLAKYLDKALDELDLPDLTWYQATRHTFASQWVLRDGSMEKLALILGHSSTEVTRRYAHLRMDLFSARDRGLFSGTGLGTFGLSSVPEPPPGVAGIGQNTI